MPTVTCLIYLFRPDFSNHAPLYALLSGATNLLKIPSNVRVQQIKPRTLVVCHNQCVAIPSNVRLMQIKIRTLVVCHNQSVENSFKCLSDRNQAQDLSSMSSLIEGAVIDIDSTILPWLPLTTP